MAVPSRLRAPNPHLGSYYGILASTFVSLIIMLAMFEQLGWGRASLAQAMMLVPLGLYLLIAIGARTMQAEDFFASGRRVPAIYNGFVLAAVAVGGVGFLAYTGAVFFLGFDGLAIGLGLTFGMLAATTLFAPYLRKAGSYTLPSFFGHRFRSRSLRIAASVMQLPPSALLLAAELKIAALIASLYLSLSFSLTILVLATLIAAFAILGGMRSLTWTGSAEFLVGAIGLAIVVTTVSILFTNVPAPQLTYGEMFQALHNAEIKAGISPLKPGEVASALPGAGAQANIKPFLQAFGIFGPFDFAMLFLAVAVGTAALPSLLMRSGVTSSIAEQRRSSAWSVLFVALFAMTVPAIAVFAKFILLRDIALAADSSLPTWLSELSTDRLLQGSDVNGDGSIGAAELLVGREGIALALPTAAGLPYVLSVLMATSALAVALAASSAHLFTLASGLAEDLYRVLDRTQALPRVLAARAAIAACALAAAVFLVIADLDPLKTALIALAFAGATFFPPLLLAIWWRRCSKWGAFAAMTSGFVILLAEIAVGGALGTSEAGITTSVATLIAVALALAVGIGVSLYLWRPSMAEDGYCEEMRDPAGETIYDRAQVRAAAAAAAANASGQ